jgi:hypothetical protein
MYWYEGACLSATWVSTGSLKVMETKLQNWPYIVKNTHFDIKLSEIIFPFNLCAAVWPNFNFLHLLFAFPRYVVILLYYSLIYHFLKRLNVKETSSPPEIEMNLKKSHS